MRTNITKTSMELFQSPPQKLSMSDWFKMTFRALHLLIESLKEKGTCIKKIWGNNTSPKAHFVQNSEVAFSKSPHKNMVNVVHVYPIMTKIIPITDPDYGPNPNYGSWLRIRDYGPGITDPGLRIRITNLDYESGYDLDYGFGLRITDPDNGIWIAINLVKIG